MEQQEFHPEIDQEEEERDNRPLFLIILFALICILVVFLIFQVRSVMAIGTDPGTSLDYPIHSTFSADYQPKPLGTKVPAVKMSIIKEALQDTYFYQEKIGSEASSEEIQQINDAYQQVAEIFQGLVPTATAYPTPTVDPAATLASTQILPPTSTPESQPTDQVSPTSTQQVSQPTNTVVPSLPPTATAVIVYPPYVPPTKEPKPTNTPTNTPTHTPAPLSVTVALIPSSNPIDEPGGNITYQVQVQNPNSVSIALLSLNDSILGSLDGVGTCNDTGNEFPTDLAASGVYICYFNLNFYGVPGDSYANTVTAEVKDALAQTASGSANALVTIADVQPSFTLSKVAGVSSVVTPGETVTFTVEVTNTSVEAVTLTHLVDDIVGSLDGVGTCAVGGTIAVSGSYSCNFTSSVTGSVGDIYKNTVTAQVSDDENNAVTQQASASVSIVAPAPASISGQVRLDANADGNMADSDTGLQGVDLELQDGVCSPSVDCAEAVSAVDGSYSFTGLYAGAYTVVATDKAGHYSTNDSAPPNDNKIPVTLVNGVDNGNNDFLDAACGPPPNAVTGFVVSSSPAASANVSYGLTQVTVQFSQLMIQDGTGSVLAAANYNNGLTNQTYGGSVPFTGITYDPSSHTATLTLDVTDPDWLPGSSYQLDILSTVEDICGQAQAVSVAINFTTMSAVGGQVRNDTDADGDLTDADEGIAGISIELQDTTCTLGTDCQTTATDANGYYLFTDLSAGDYVVHETDPEEYDSTNDFDSGNFNQIGISSLGASEYLSERDFLDKISCANPDPTNGFVVFTLPINGQTNVGLFPPIITIIYNQPMSTSGSSSPGNPSNYTLENLTLGSGVNFTSIIYLDGLSSVLLTVNSASGKWAPGNDYRFSIDGGIENVCGVSQDVVIEVNFQTAP